MGKELEILEKASKLLFHPEKMQEELSDKEREILKRYQALYALWLSNPMISDVELRSFLTDNFDLEKSQAYLYISNLKVLLGNIRNASKEVIRYMVNEGLKGIYQRALAKEDDYLAKFALADLAKYNMLDKSEDEKPPYENIIPSPFEATPDIKVFDPKYNNPRIDELKEYYRKKFNVSDEPIENAEIVE